MFQKNRPCPVKLGHTELAHAGNLARDYGAVPRGLLARLVAHVGLGGREAPLHLVLAERLEALAQQLLEVRDAPVHRAAAVVHKAVAAVVAVRLHCRLGAVPVVRAAPQRVPQHRVDALELLEQLLGALLFRFWRVVKMKRMCVS